MAGWSTWIDRLLSIKGANNEFIKALGSLKKGVDQSAKALAIADHSIGTGHLEASDEDIEAMHRLALALANHAASLARRTEDDWMIESGCNAFSLHDTAESLRRLLEQRGQITARRDTCDVLRTLVRVQFLKTHMNLKGLAKAWIPSLVALDAIAVRESETDLAAAVANFDVALRKLQRAIDAVSNLRDGQHQFLTISRSQNAPSDVARIRRALEATAAPSR